MLVSQCTYNLLQNGQLFQKRDRNPWRKIETALVQLRILYFT